MKISITILLILFCFTTHGQNPTGIDKKREKEILHLDSLRINALIKNDTAFLSRLYADDYMMISSTGEIRTKADQLRDIGAGSVLHEKGEEKYLKIRFYGNVAVVQSESTGKVIINGKASESLRRFTRVFVKRNGRWQLIATHISRVQ
jgi:ketosteroid isomerase-like protein